MSWGVEKPLFTIGLISFCADQISSCVLSYAKIASSHVSFTAYEYFYKLSSSDPEEPVIQQSNMYLPIHLCPKIRIHNGYHFPVISFPYW